MHHSRDRKWNGGCQRLRRRDIGKYGSMGREFQSNFWRLVTQQHEYNLILLSCTHKGLRLEIVC